jgi:CheY-like chemotaxis protein
LTPVVLYIDDSGVERRIVQRLLEDDGFRVFTAEKAEEGLEMAARVRPDMILLDLHLEGTEGCQLAERLREMPGLEKVPIVAISASLKDEERPEVLERFDGYVQKPVDVDLFPRMVREFMWQGAREGHPPVQGLPSGKGIAVSPSGGAAVSRGSATQPGREGEREGERSPDAETRELLEALEKVRSVMSHDLRTPLTVMISYASTVSRGKVGELNERQKEMLDLVVQHGFQMDAQIAELVKLARDTLRRFGYKP